MALFGALRAMGLASLSFALSLWILFSSANFSNGVSDSFSHCLNARELLGRMFESSRLRSQCFRCLPSGFICRRYFLSALFGVLYAILLSRQFKSEGLKRCLPYRLRWCLWFQRPAMAWLANRQRQQDMIAFSQHMPHWVEMDQ